MEFRSCGKCFEDTHPCDVVCDECFVKLHYDCAKANDDFSKIAVLFSKIYITQDCSFDDFTSLFNLITSNYDLLDDDIMCFETKNNIINLYKNCNYTNKAKNKIVKIVMDVMDCNGNIKFTCNMCYNNVKVEY